MKILLSSDWHLGKSLYTKKLLQEQAKFFQDEFFPLLKDIKPDLLIVAGDILDNPNPDQETLFFYEELLKELSSFQIPTFIILGNHDSRRTSFHKFFLAKAKIYFIDDLRFFFFPVKFSGNDQERLNLYFLPYLPLYELHCKAKEQYGLTSSDELTYKNLLKALFSQVSFEKPALLVSHFALENAYSSGEEALIKGLAEDYLIPKDFLRPFDLVFLGHLHKHQVIGEKVFYPGAPLPYSFESYEEKRGVCLYIWEREQLLHWEFIPLNTPYRLVTLQGNFEEIMKHPQTMAYVKVLLEEEVYDAYEKLRSRFPNLLALESLKSKKEIRREEDFNENSENLFLDERTLFKEFYKWLEGKEIESDLWSLYEKYLTEFYLNESKEGRLCQ